MDFEDSFRQISPKNPFLDKFSVEFSEEDEEINMGCDPAINGVDPIVEIEDINQVIDRLAEEESDSSSTEIESDLEFVTEHKDELLLGSQLLKQKIKNNDIVVDHKDCVKKLNHEKELRINLEFELELERQQRIQFQQQLSDFNRISLQRQFNDNKQIKILRSELFKCKRELQTFKDSNIESNNTPITSADKNKSNFKDFNCVDCNEVMKSEVTMLLHFINHCVDEEEFRLSTRLFKLDEFSDSVLDTIRKSVSYICPRCSQSFNCNDIYYHIYKCHTKEQALVCTSCNTYCTHIDYLRTHHQDSHEGLLNKIVYTKILDNRFSETKSNNGLTINRYSNKSAFKPYDINLRNCNSNKNNSKKTSTNSDSDSDEPEIINLSDSPVPTFKSSVPSKPSVTSIPTKVAPKEFECSFADCEFKTLSKEKLDFHISAHTNSKFKCPYCPYVGNLLNDIHRHIQKSKRHEGLKVYECKECNFGTNCLSSFKEHLSKKHFDNDSEDEGIDEYITNIFRNEYNVNFESDKSDPF